MDSSSYRISGLLAPILFFAQVAAGATVAWDEPDNAGFQAAVLPFLSSKCYTCHSDKLQSGGFNAQAFQTAASVAKDSARWQVVSEKLLSRQMPPPGMPRPGESEIKAVTDWVAKEIDREDRGSAPDPGHITARRLNRTEYNNAVRDLLGVDSAPADDFPPDDSGYGFDNIGDVLSLSPSLMEKYVSVAEKVARCAVYGPPPMKPALVKHEPWYIDFDTRPGVKIDYDETGLSLPSALHVMHRFPVEGDYDLAGLLRGNRPFGSEPMQVAYWIDGKQIAVIPYAIPASGEVSGQRKEFRTHVTAGEHWMAVSFLRIYEGLPMAFHGPNPSKLPPPPVRNFGGRGGGRGGAGNGGAGRGGAGRGAAGGAANGGAAGAAADPNAANNNEGSAGAAVGLFISNLEVTGPYNQVAGPAEASRRRIFVCSEETPACARKIVTTLAGRVYRRRRHGRKPISLRDWSRWLGKTEIRFVKAFASPSSG